MSLQIGDVVDVSGLQSRPELNGLKATVEDFDPEKERWTVRFVTGVGTQPVILALKAGNLQKVTAPPPPPKPPTVRAGSSHFGGNPPGFGIAGGPPPPPPNMVNGGAPEEEESAPPLQHHASSHGASEWIQASAGDGRAYWYNQITKESTWEDPRGRAGPTRQASDISDAQVTPQEQQQPPPPQQAVEAPEPEWKTLHNEQYDRDYYYNTRTGETTWTMPAGLALERASSSQGSSLAGDASSASPRGGSLHRAPSHGGGLIEGSAAAAGGGAGGGGAAAAGGGGGGGGGGDAAAVAQQAAAMMREAVAAITRIYDDAAQEELVDRGGGEHGAAQAQEALDIAKGMLERWEHRLRSL